MKPSATAVRELRDYVKRSERMRFSMLPWWKRALYRVKRFFGP